MEIWIKKVLTDFFTRQNYGSQKFNHSKLYIVEIGYSEQIYHSGKFPLYPGMTVFVMYRFLGIPGSIGWQSPGASEHFDPS